MLSKEASIKMKDSSKKNKQRSQKAVDKRSMYQSKKYIKKMKTEEGKK
jgi:hypothetical protein